jgi:hypothetical protein
MIVLLLLVFIMGMFFGAGLFISFGLYQVHKIKKVKNILIDQIKKKASELEAKKGSIKDRLVKASNIAQTQMDLKSQSEMPSKNALHSRHKNGIVYEIQDLEQEKLSILRSVLGDGFDPMITVINDGGVKEEIPLSAYVAQAEQLLHSMTGIGPAIPPDTKKIGKLILYKGGKDDGTTH